MKLLSLLLILFTIPALALSCNRHTASHTVQTDQSDTSEIVLDESKSELCRVVVNYKNNRHLYVEFGKNGFKPIDAQGTLVKLDDEWGVISIAKFQFDDQRITSNEFILRMMNSSHDVLFQIQRPMKSRDDFYLDYKTWSFYCFPYAYHSVLDGFLLYTGKVISNFTELLLDDDIEFNKARSYLNKSFKDIKSRKIELCEQAYDWMIYQNKDSLRYICEATQFDRNLKVYEMFNNLTTVYINTKSTTCKGKSSDENFSSIRIRSNPDKDYIFTINSFIRALIPNDVSDKDRKSVGRERVCV